MIHDDISLTEMNAKESTNQENDDIEAARRRLYNIAEQAQKEKKIQIMLLTDEALIISVLTNIPILCNLCARLKSFSTSTYTLVTLSEKAQTIELPSRIQLIPGVEKTFANIGLIAAIANFLTLPMLFLACKILKKPSPVTLSTFGEWSYSALLLALTITAAAAPITAPFIGAAMVLMGLGYSVYLLDKFTSERNDLIKKNTSTDYDLNTFYELLSEQKNKMRGLQADLQQADSVTILKYDELIIQCVQDIQDIYQSIEQHMNTKTHIDQQLETYNNTALLDCCMGFSVASILMVGLYTGLFFPPVGFLITTTATCLGTGYLLSRLVVAGSISLYDQLHSSNITNSSAEHNSSTAKMMSNFSVRNVSNDDNNEHYEEQIERKEETTENLQQAEDQYSHDLESEETHQIESPGLKL